jgi:chromate transporter
MIYIRLLLVFFKIGLFSFGGGYAILAMMNQEIVELNQWVTEKEFIDIVAISQSTPGPIAINAATYIGYKAAPNGFIGSVIATAGVVLPSLIIMLIICKFFFKFKNNKYMESALKGLRPATVGLIAAAAIMVADGAFIDVKSILIFIGAFIASFKFKADPILLTVISGVLGFILY